MALAISALSLACATGPRDVPLMMRGWNEPFEPFRIAGNIHYVGTNIMAIFLLTTPEGHILIDSGFDANVPQLRKNVEALGFRFQDIKILVASHAHIDHVQGHAQVRALTGARVVVSEADAPTVTTGGQHEWAYGELFAWPPCPVDQLVKDGDQVSLGGTTLTAHLTPGHSRGATTWTTTVEDQGQRLAVVFFPGSNVPPGAHVTNNPAYPDAVAAFEQSFRTWKSLPCDLFLGAHGEFFDLKGKWKRWKTGAQPNPFVDPAGYQEAIAQAEKKFRAQLEKER